MARQWYALGGQWYEDGTEEWYAGGVQLAENQAAGGGTQTLQPPAIASSATLYAPTLSPGPVSLAPPLIASAATLYGPTVVPGAVTLAAPLIASAATQYGPTVAPGSVTLAMPAIGSGTTLFGPVVSSGSATLLPPVIGSTASLFGPTVAPGPVSLSPPPLGPTAALFAPLVSAGGQAVAPPAIPSGSTLFAPAVSSGAVTLAAPLLAGGTTLFGPRVGIWVAVPGIGAGSVLYAPTVGELATTTLTAPAIAAGSTLYAPAIFAEPVILTRDDRVMLKMRDALAATNRYVRVDAVTGPKDIVHGSDIRNYAMLWFEQCEDIDHTMSGDEADFDHTAQFTLAIGVHEDDPTVRLRKLGELKAVAQNALNGKAHVDGMIPHLTLLRRTRRDRDAKPIDSVWLITGEYAWFDVGYDGRDDTDDLAPPGYDPDAEPPPSGGPVAGVGGLAFTVAAGTYRMTDDSSVNSPGDFGTATDDATIRAWLTAAGTLATGGSFPGSVHAPLASVTAAGGEITAVVDETI